MKCTVAQFIRFILCSFTEFSLVIFFLQFFLLLSGTTINQDENRAFVFKQLCTGDVISRACLSSSSRYTGNSGEIELWLYLWFVFAVSINWKTTFSINNFHFFFFFSFFCLLLFVYMQKMVSVCCIRRHLMLFIVNFQSKARTFLLLAD